MTDYKTEQFSRTELLIGKEALRRLREARVAVFGVGGVGGYTVEALARSGVGGFDLIDNDTVAPSNMNRQIIATRDTVGKYKVDVMRERILSINPHAGVRVHKCFFLPENAAEFDFADYSYVVDAVDTVTAKIEIIMRAKAAGVPVISSMGAGNKLDPTKFCVTDIYRTEVCPLAKVMRRELRKRGVESLKVVYSTEAAIRPGAADRTVAEAEPAEAVFGTGAAGGEAALSGQDGDGSRGRRKQAPGSIAFVPSVAGLIAAGEVVKDLIGSDLNQIRFESDKR